MSGADDDRHARPTHEFDSRELAKLTRRDIVSIPIDAVEDPFGGWDDELADGTPLHTTAPLMSRTATVADPLTTGLLAEVSRRAATAEITPAELAEALDADPDRDDRDDRDARDPTRR